MGNFSELSNDLLVKILLLIPIKEAVATSLLSKQWRSVWKLVPKLEYDDFCTATASQFIGKFLQLNNAPCLDILHLKLKRDYALRDYETWVNVGVARNVRDLELYLDRSCLSPIPLPKSLYTHQTLVVLCLRQAIIEDVPSTTCFQCVKSLSLLFVSFSSDETVDKLLSCCPVLEKLVVRRWGNDNVKTFAICVPSLQSLDIQYVTAGYQDHGFVISAPCLKYLEIVDHFSGFCSLPNIPVLEKAEIYLRHCDSEKLLGCLTSAKHLSLCLKPQMVSYPQGDFGQLVSLELCVRCCLDWLNLILRHSPRLRLLTFRLLRDSSCRNSKIVPSKWEQPSCVPECLISSLETVEWIGYKGTQEKELVMYLLETGNFLETMSIRFSLSTTLEEKNRMQMELDSKPRSSSKCQLSFT